MLGGAWWRYRRGSSLVSWACPRAVSRYCRIWPQARSAAVMPGAARLRPYDLRHAALSLWLASGAVAPEYSIVCLTCCFGCRPDAVMVG